MATHSRVSQPINGAGLIELGPPAAERAPLESAPGADVVEFYFLTEAANRAWAAISARLASGTGAVFWIGGPAGAGKTHFLNYVLALEERAGITRGRRAIVRLGLEARGEVYDVEQRMFELLAREIGSGDAGATLWRQLHGGEALGVAFEQAHRVGLRAISVAIDFGASDAVGWDGYIAELARAAALNRQVAFNLYVAARTRAPAGAIALEVAPAGVGERILAAVARSRRILDETTVAALYDGTDLGAVEPHTIFPFDPRAIETLGNLAEEPASVASLAKLVSAALAAYRENAEAGMRPLLPIELVAAPAVAKRMEQRLGEAGRAALSIAHRAAEAMEERDRARGIVDVLMLERLGVGARALSPGELRARLPQHYRRGGSASAASAAIAAMLEALAARTGGVITFEARGAQFNPRAAAASEVASFNRALALIQRFDSTLIEAAEPPQVRTRLKRAGEVMARAMEAAHRVDATLEAAHRELRAELQPEHRRTLDDFIALAGSGADALIEQASTPQSRAQAERVIAAYETLAAAAAAAPRIREVRDYLRATALIPDIAGDDPALDHAVAAAQVECQLLLAALDNAVPHWEPRSLDALEIRFQKFKWNYIQIYQAAHERWRRESERMTVEIATARAHFGVLGRLNSIAALGASIGEALERRIEELERRVTRCAPDAAVALDLVPCCRRCGFVLGTTLPASELGEIFEDLSCALKAKLTALSQDAIARLIRQHDRGHRLDGFLKIIQAAHTEALVRVLDDNLARYLGRLLDEVREEEQNPAQSEMPGMIEPFPHTRRAALRIGKRAERTVKTRSE
jgi:hypothetical protein